MRRIPVVQRRAELIAAAIRVIARDGLAAASTRAIVAEADMPLGAFHYAFTSRDELLAAVIEGVTDAERIAAVAGTGLVSRSVTRDTVEVEEVFIRGFEGYLEYLENAPSGELALFEVAFHAMRHDPDAVRTQWQTYRRASEQALAHAADAAGVRWLRPVAELAHSLTSTVDGLTVTWLADRDSAAARAHIRFLAASFAALTVPTDTREAPDAD